MFFRCRWILLVIDTSLINFTCIAALWTEPTELAGRYYEYQTKLYPPSSQVWPYKMKTEQWVVREILVLLSGCSSELFSIQKDPGSDIKIDVGQIQVVFILRLD